MHTPLPFEQRMQKLKGIFNMAPFSDELLSVTYCHIILLLSSFVQIRAQPHYNQPLSSSGVEKHFCMISGSRDIRKTKLDIITRNIRYWLNFCLQIWCLIVFCLHFCSLLYRNGVEPEAYQRKDCIIFQDIILFIISNS